MKHSESIGAISAALAKAQGAMEGAKKAELNPHFKKKYADLSSVVVAIKEALAANGIAYFQSPVTNDKDEAGCETLLCHSSGEWLLGEPWFLPVQRADAQGFGSALTYARRYSLMAACGIAPEDDDGNAAAAAKPDKVFPSAPIPANVEGQELLAAASPEERRWLEDQADVIRGLFHAGKNLAEYWDAQHYDTEQKLALSCLLDAPTRRRIKDQQREAVQKKQSRELSTQG